MPSIPRIVALALLSFTAAAYATQRGITEKGDEVLLEDDGTWRYVKAQKEAPAPAPISVNAQRFTRHRESSFPVRSSRNNAVVYIDPKKWQFSKATKNPEQEFTFRSQAGDLYGVMITERVNLPIDQLASIVLNNMRGAAPDAEILSQEYRYVNDRKVLYLRLNATVKGMKLVYHAYVYSDDGGTTQLLVFTTQNLAAAYAPNAEEFLNGLSFQAAP